MTGLFEHVIIFVLLLAGFTGLFFLIEPGRFVEEGIINARKNMDAHDRKFRSEKRKHLAEHEEKNTFLWIKQYPGLWSFLLDSKEEKLFNFL